MFLRTGSDNFSGYNLANDLQRRGQGSITRVSLENGAKGHKFVCYANDWPDLQRNGKTAEAALETVALYRDRYARVADRAGLASAFVNESVGKIVEEYTGTPSTDFWESPFATVHWIWRGLTPTCWSEG